MVSLLEAKRFSLGQNQQSQMYLLERPISLCDLCVYFPSAAYYKSA